MEKEEKKKDGLPECLECQNAAGFVECWNGAIQAILAIQLAGLASLEGQHIYYNI